MNLKDKTVVIDNKTYRYSKIAMLETNKPGFTLDINSQDRLHIPFDPKTPHDYIGLKNKPQHLYFLSTDKICEEDWYLNVVSNDIVKVNFTIDYEQNHCFKIIASTDPYLNLPKPSDSFLQVYIDAYNKGEKIEECLVEYEEENVPICSSNVCETIKTFKSTNLKTTKGEITIRKVKDSWNREEHIKSIKNAIYEAIKFPEQFVYGICVDDKAVNTWIENNL